MSFSPTHARSVSEGFVSTADIPKDSTLWTFLTERDAEIGRVETRLQELANVNLPDGAQTYQTIFDLPHEEVLLKSWSGAFQKQQGKLYLSKNYVCFHSKTKHVTKIPVPTITAVEKKRSRLVPAIRIRTISALEYTFECFFNRDSVYSLLKSIVQKADGRNREYSNSMRELYASSMKSLYPSSPESELKNEGPAVYVEDEVEECEQDRDVRARVAHEIYTTEYEYFKNLKTLQFAFAIPLRRNKALSNVDYDKIFACLDMITTFQEKFLEDLTAHWYKDGCLAKVFVDHANGFRCYATYVKLYDIMERTYSHLMDTNTFFQKFVRETEGYLKKKMLSLCINPVQRLPRYELLLKELLDATDSYHHEYNDISKALNLIHETNVFVNESKKLYENQLEISCLKREITNSEIEIDIPGRRLIRKGAVSWFKNKRGDILAPCILYLFNDILIHCDKRHHYLGSYIVKYLIVVPKPDMIEDPPKGLLLIDKKQRISLIIVCRTKDEIDDWKNEIDDIIEEGTEKKKHPRSCSISRTVIPPPPPKPKHQRNMSGAFTDPSMYHRHNSLRNLDAVRKAAALAREAKTRKDSLSHDDDPKDVKW